MQPLTLTTPYPQPLALNTQKSKAREVDKISGRLDRKKDGGGSRKSQSHGGKSGGKGKSGRWKAEGIGGGTSTSGWGRSTVRRGRGG